MPDAVNKTVLRFIDHFTDVVFVWVAKKREDCYTYLREYDGEAIRNMYTVLIADDENVERAAVCFLLEQYFPGKFRIVQASNGKEALTLVQSQDIDVLFSDIQMPFLTGIELAREARAICPNIELLFFSGFDDFEFVQNALVLRAVNYVLKPLDPEQFCQAVNEILSRLDTRDSSNDYYSLTFPQDPHAEASAEPSGLTDSALLKNIDLAIQLKQPTQLSNLTNELMERCSDGSGRSHMYIRHTAANLIQILIGGIPTLETAELDAATEKIYTLHHFSDIQKIVQTYLDLLLQNLHQEIDAPNYAVHRVKQYIEEHYGEDLTISFLADQVYLSPNYLSNMFTKVTGLSPNKYIRQIRMKEARKLLINTNMKISDIGKAVGYPTTSYFIRAFQRTYGITPMNCRLDHKPIEQISE